MTAWSTERARSRIGAPGDMETEIGPVMHPRAARAYRGRHRRLPGRRGAPRHGRRGAGAARGTTSRRRSSDCADARDAPCLTTEFFSPVLSVLGFDTEEEALALANGHEVRPRLGPLHERSGPRSPHDRRPSGRRRLGQHLPRGQPHRARRRSRPLRPTAARAGSQAILDYTKIKTVWLRTSSEPIPDPFVMR